MSNATKNSAPKNNAADKQEPNTNADKIVEQAHKQAEKDIEKDPDLQPDPTNDLDEGELARLEGED